MIKSWLKTIVRPGAGQFGIGLEMFRLKDVDEDDLTDEEKEAVEDSLAEDDEDEDEKENMAIIRVYEDIGENFWDGSGMSVKKFAEALDGLGELSKLHIHINSLGGDTHTAQAIYNLIGDHPSKTTSFIDGIAASAATVVASGAEHIVMRKNANYMIHNPWTVAMGNASDMRKAAEDLDKVTEPIVNVYKTQTGNKLSKDKIIALMNEETWLTADEALKYGFVDEVRGKSSAIASAGKGRLLVNGKIFNIARYGYRHVPTYPIVDTPNIERDPIKFQQKDKQKKAKGKMTLEELQQVDPDLVASIRADSSKGERDRLAALNAMMAPGLEAIISKAIEDGSTPASIAMQCFAIVKDNAESAARVNSLRRDAAPAGGVPAGDAPYTPPNKPQDNKKAAASKSIAAAFQKDPRQQARAKSGNGRLMLN